MAFCFFQESTCLQKWTFPDLLIAFCCFRSRVYSRSSRRSTPEASFAGSLQRESARSQLFARGITHVGCTRETAGGGPQNAPPGGSPCDPKSKGAWAAPPIAVFQLARGSRAERTVSRRTSPLGVFQLMESPVRSPISAVPTGVKIDILR